MKKHFFVSLLLVMLLAAPASAIGLYEGYDLATGTITAKGVPANSTAPDNYCKLSYTVTLDGVGYSDDTEGFSDFCHLEAGDSVKIKYLVSDPRKHTIASEFEINDMSASDESVMDFATPFAIVYFIIGTIPTILIIRLIIRTIRNNKHPDTDGDGLAGDNKPATAEQKKLIQEGFRRLGIHHVVKKKLTQAEARETLREINQKLHRK